MANQSGRPDDNAVKTAIAVSSVDFKSTVTLAADPNTHRLLVDVAGGVQTGAIGFEIPAGTVDGVNTVFTVQNIPQFVEVSGQVMASSTQDPTNYGYTLTGTFAPYTITFLSAPQTTQTPHSWYNLVSGSSINLSSFFETDSFVATSNQTVFTTTLTPVFVFSVVLQGQVQVANVDYTQSGSVFTLTSGVPASTYVEISYLHQ